MVANEGFETKPENQDELIPAMETSDIHTEKTTSSNRPIPTKRFTGFHGTYSHSIDAKGRLIIPQCFRELLGDEMVIGVNMAQDCIVVYPYETWQNELDELYDLCRYDATLQPYVERFSKYSYPNSSFDQQGRVLLPVLLREKYLNNAQTVQVSGGYQYIRILTDEQAEQEEETFKNAQQTPLEKISNVKKERLNQLKNK